MHLTNGMARFQFLPFLTNQEIINDISWLIHIIQSDFCYNRRSNLIGAESCDLVGWNSQICIGCWEWFWLVNWTGPIRPWSFFFSGVVVCHLVGNNGMFTEWGSRAHVLGFRGPGSMWQKCSAFVQCSCGWKACFLSWTVCDYLCWPYCAVFALIYNPCFLSYVIIKVVFDLKNR